MGEGEWDGHVGWRGRGREAYLEGMPATGGSVPGARPFTRMGWLILPAVVMACSRSATTVMVGGGSPCLFVSKVEKSEKGWVGWSVGGWVGGCGVWWRGEDGSEDRGKDGENMGLQGGEGEGLGWASGPAWGCGPFALSPSVCVCCVCVGGGGVGGGVRVSVRVGGVPKPRSGVNTAGWVAVKSGGKRPMWCWRGKGI